MVKKRQPLNKLSEISLLKRLAVLLVIIVLILTGIYFGAVPILSHLTTIWDIFSPPRGTVPARQDTIAPPPPFLENLPPATNQVKIKVGGLAEPGSTVEIFLNDEAAGTTLTDKQGGFSFEGLRLSKGTNTIFTKAKDQAGNESQSSTVFTIAFDKTPPELEIQSPSSETSFTKPSLTVKGITDPTATVFINEHQAVVGSDGTFSYTVFLQEGENLLKIEAVDAAGNKTTVEQTVSYTPEGSEE